MDARIFEKPSKPCFVGVHWIALAECSQMSIHVPGCQSFFRIFASFCDGKISHQQAQGLETQNVFNLSVLRAAKTA